MPSLKSKPKNSPKQKTLCNTKRHLRHTKCVYCNHYSKSLKQQKQMPSNLTSPKF